MAESFYTGGSAGPFSFAFASYQSSDVRVSVDGVDKTVSTHYTISNYTTSGGGQVTFTSGNIPTGTQTIRIYRQTDVAAMKATFAAGSSIKSEDLNNNFKQLRLQADEAVGPNQISNHSITSAKIKDGSIETVDIKDANVTTAKLADSAVTTAKIAGDAVDGTKIADDSINSEHYVDGSIDTAHIADANITTAKLADLSVTTAKLASDAVTTAKIADSAVTSAKIADGTISTADIGDGQVATAKLAASSVVEAKIANNAVTQSKIAAGAVTQLELALDSVTTAKIADDAVTSAKIGSSAVTDAKINSVASSKLTGALSNSLTMTSEGGSATTIVGQGLAKLWITTAGNGTSIYNSFNVSSLGDDSTGVQTININNDMSNGNYAIGVSTGDAGTYSLATANVSTGSYKGYYYSGHTSNFHDGGQKHVLTGDLA